MSSINHLLEALDEGTITRKVSLVHDEARIQYALPVNTVATFDEFARVIGAYYNYHFGTCISRGGRLSATEAVGRAKDILIREYRGGSNAIVAAFNNANDGRKGGLRSILDTIAEALKKEAVERYVREAFDRHVAPNAWEANVDLIRQFFAKTGDLLDRSTLRTDQPERYAADYTDVVRAFVLGMEQTSSVLRRL
jgi:hypothetical protein